jgi:integrase
MYIEEYVTAAGIEKDAEDTPLFRSTVRKTKVLTTNMVTANDIHRMVKRRLQDAELPSRYLSCHSFRATAITDLLTQGVPLEDVQYLAGHSDPRTTRLYDRRQRQVTRNIVERISMRGADGLSSPPLPQYAQEASGHMSDCYICR